MTKCGSTHHFDVDVSMLRLEFRFSLHRLPLRSHMRVSIHDPNVRSDVAVPRLNVGDDWNVLCRGEPGLQSFLPSALVLFRDTGAYGRVT